jgi:hypothetical protein
MFFVNKIYLKNALYKNKMVIEHLKKDVENYKIPPMGPMIYISYNGDTHKNAVDYLNFALERLDIFESSKDYISILEYMDLSEFVYNCMGHILLEKDTFEYNTLQCDVSYNCGRFSELLETHEFINDIPEEYIKIGDNQTILLYFQGYRAGARRCISTILCYLNSNRIENESDAIIKNHIKTYLKYIIDNEIFSKEDLLTYNILENYM